MVRTPTFSTPNGQSPLSWTLTSELPESSLLLIQHGAKLDERADGKPFSLFVIAAAPGLGPRILQAMLDRGADINAQDTGGQTALMFATVTKDVTTVRFLLSHHANVTMKDFDGRTALDLAQSAPDLPETKQILHMLQQAGAH